MLVENLPPDSAVHRRLLGHTWTSERDWLTADIRDMIGNLLVAYVNVNRRKGSPTVSPIPPVIRPGGDHVDPELEERAARESHQRLAKQLLPGRR